MSFWVIIGDKYVIFGIISPETVDRWQHYVSRFFAQQNFYALAFILSILIIMFSIFCKAVCMQPDQANKISSNWMRCCGSTSGSKRKRGSPDGAIRNFSKFHCTSVGRIGFQKDSSFTYFDLTGASHLDCEHIWHKEFICMFYYITIYIYIYIILVFQ